MFVFGAGCTQCPNLEIKEIANIEVFIPGGLVKFRSADRMLRGYGIINGAGAAGYATLPDARGAFFDVSSRTAIDPKATFKVSVQVC